jgi:hypothetical protein
MRYARVALAAVLVAAVLTGAGCPARPTIRKAGFEESTVAAFLEAMVAADEEAQAALISPAWLAEREIDLESDEYSVNSYSPDGFRVTAVEGDVVTAELDFDDGSAHRLRFRVRAENGRGYVVPGSHDEPDWEDDSPGWVHPWLDVETNVR